MHCSDVVEAAGVHLASETDEQGLQVALVTSERRRVVSAEQVSICGSYWPHLEKLGTCGAHFVGANVKDPQHAQIWDAKKAEVEQLLKRVGPRP